jgi:two-component system, sporulation sensor kinase A
MQLLKETSKNKYYFEMMSNELERIELITNEFLVLAKPQVKAYDRKQLQTILESVITLAEIQGLSNNVEIIKEFESNLLSVLCEQNQLKQVFMNIVKNAIEAMPEGGKIHIQLKMYDHEKIMIRFIDHGYGITDDRIQHLGEPFYSTKEKGTGLGLMVSYKIIREHQGKINFSSEVGKGTVVDIIFPASFLK